MPSETDWEGKLETVRDHDADVARVIAGLSPTSKTPVVVGESDIERDAVARGVAMKLAFGDAPDALRGKRVFRLSLDALAKGAKTSDDFAARVQAVFAEAAQAEGKVILFVDQLHEYAGARATGEKVARRSRGCAGPVSDFLSLRQTSQHRGDTAFLARSERST